MVDAVHKHAQRLVQYLQENRDGPLAAMCERLGELQVVHLPGGVFGDDDWVLYPERLSIVLTTVDQLGSRLLFRGYGVSPQRWSLHAGFFSDDTLIVVDEAHLNRPFLQTLAVLQGTGADLSVIPVTATSNLDGPEKCLSLDERDFAHDIVQLRRNASKRVRLQEVGASDQELSRAALLALANLRNHPEVRKIALVVNRASTARTLFEQIRARKVDCALLTERMRPFEADRLANGVFHEVRAGRHRYASDRLFVVIATHTIETGSDFDFDALISECAPLSALRQRFGRLDRLGQLGQSQGWVLHRSGQKADLVYGDALPSAWAWLMARAAEAGGYVDFGLNAFDQSLATAPAPAEGYLHAATLLPRHIQILSQTGPYAPEVDLTAWLHGHGHQVADVILIWRDDLSPLPAEDWITAVALLPPMLREGLPLPAPAARRFLNSADSEDRNGTGHGRTVLCWRGPDDVCLITPEDIRPGDTLVLPAHYGGCDRWGWAPESAQPVQDLADACQLERLQAAGAAHRFTLRLADGHWPMVGQAARTIETQTRILLQLQQQREEEEVELDAALKEAYLDLLALLAQLPGGLVSALRDPRIEPHPGGLVIRGQGIEDLGDLIETGRPVSLERHHRNVARWAETLSPHHPQRWELVQAAGAHDAGKAEVHMQVLLHGHPLPAACGPALAKSARHSLALHQAGLPRGFRHEFASLVFEPMENPLVRHLVATHHGQGRPWSKSCSDSSAPGAGFAALQGHWLQHWNDLCQQYGPWRLAQLEWRLRAADARATMEEALQTEEAAP
ncbi:CRISPR-associated protein (plasmid) [Azotobacter chroococcum NCIMB 8003]|uniref:CRISPR-associated protein n=2 Tax=Azotobacter chroococcum TaxID=353 RepID=A0A0C4WST2_9GAMM|nr:CRISPR-associated protein [Azotobacter chroococcum NCIMB 8003]